MNKLRTPLIVINLFFGVGNIILFLELGHWDSLVVGLLNMMAAWMVSTTPRV